LPGYHSHGYGNGFDDPDWNPADPNRPEYDPDYVQHDHDHDQTHEHIEADIGDFDIDLDVDDGEFIDGETEVTVKPVTPPSPASTRLTP